MKFESMDMSYSYEDRLNKFKSIINECNRIVFFGGAGVSTGSGIPDFRSKDGLYNNIPKEYSKYSPEYLLSNDCFNHNPKVFYTFYKNMMDVREYEPNVVHKYLANLEREGKCLGIITQNIDTLHEKAGSTKLYKIHGTIDKNHCIKCGREYDINYIFDSTEVIPKCSCGRENCFVRPNIVLYGENLPKDAMNGAFEVISKADCLIVSGTSLTVQPAASLVNYTIAKYIVIINREPTIYDNYADVVFREDMNDVFNYLKV